MINYCIIKIKFGAMKDRHILYKLLGVDPDASTVEIKKSYRTLALQFHPDKNQEDPEARVKFQKLTEAYQLLTDP